MSPTLMMSSLPGLSRRGWLLVALALLVPGLSAGVWWWHSRAEPPAGPPVIDSDDPRLTFPTRYRNVRPDVQYVGDGACAECHSERSESYHQHPMGRSLAPAHSPQTAEGLGAEGRAAFEAFGISYLAERRGDRLFHRETPRAPPGEAPESVERRVNFVIGSGRRAASYLIEEDGYLFQSPITWFPQKRVWDLSPSNRQGREHFDRPVTAECLFCHSNRAEPVENTLNHYHPSVFRGEAIGCERCHGPGELHVRRQKDKRTEPGEVDETIVNPSLLEPALRDAVCEQCHLGGLVRVLRRGRGVFDYRPGLPLHLFWTVFEKPAGADADGKLVSQVEQMHASRCFQQSKGELGCVTCHDPHLLPAEERRVTYYRDRCLGCHTDKNPCSLSLEKRFARGNDCAACHMPRRESTDIAHDAVSDHRILRDLSREPPRPRPAGPGPPLVHFHASLVPEGQQKKWVERDLGVALMEMAREDPPGPVRAAAGQIALPGLREAVRSDPTDLAAGEALGMAWLCLEQPLDSLEACEAVLARAPEREQALADAAVMAGHLNRSVAAVGYWQRAIAVSPRRWQYHYNLAAELRGRGRPADALPECETALRLNPADVETRQLQVGCLVELDRKDEARAAFARLMALKPANEEKLRRWFDGLLP